MKQYDIIKIKNSNKYKQLSLHDNDIGLIVDFIDGNPIVLFLNYNQRGDFGKIIVDISDVTFSEKLSENQKIIVGGLAKILCIM